MMDKGEGEKYKGMTLDEIDVQLEDDVQPENEEYFDGENGVDLPLHDIIDFNLNSTPEVPSSNGKVKKIIKNKKREVHSWTQDQKRIVTDFFKNEIKEKCPPKTHQVLQLYEENPSLNLPQQWEKVKLVYKMFIPKKIKYLNEDL